MGAGADDEQVLDVLRAVVGAEPGALEQRGFQPEGRTLGGGESVFEVDGRDQLLGDDVLAEAGHHGAVKVFGDGRLVGGGAGGPVDP